MDLEIFNFSWFHDSEKLFFSTKLLIKRKIQENSAHLFGENCLTNHLAKFLQGRIKPQRVAALRLSTGYNFFYKKGEGFITCFNLSR